MKSLEKNLANELKKVDGIEVLDDILEMNQKNNSPAFIKKGRQKFSDFFICHILHSI